MILLSLILILLGGCQMGKDKLPSEMNPKDLPEGRAFEDEFTRGLLQSTEEVSQGYYSFVAKNRKWKSAFPKDGLTNDLDYTSKDNFESLIYTDWEDGKDTSATVNVSYYSSFNPGHVESKKNGLRSKTGYHLDFEEIPRDNQTYYIASFEEKVEEEKNALLYGYVAYIQKESEAGGIYVIYRISCEVDCEESKEAELKETYDWIKTIQFVDESKDDAE